MNIGRVLAMLGACVALLTVVLTDGVLAQCANPPSGMVGWWSLDEPDGSAKALDHVNGLDGDYVNGCVDKPGVVGRSKFFNYSFGGSGNQYVQIPATPLLDMGTGDFSIDAWIMREKDASLYIRPQPIFCHSFCEIAVCGPNYGYTFEIMDNHVAIEMGGSAGVRFEGNTIISEEEWHHLAVTIQRDGQDNPIGTFYVDGQPDGTFIPPIVNLDLPSYLAGFDFSLIGHGWCNHPWIAATGSCGFTNPELLGQIDELEVFRRALTAGEVHSIWLAESAGKCQIACSLPEHLTACAAGTAPGDVVICNIDSADRMIAWSLQTPTYSPLGCTAQGPVSFSPSSGTQTVPAGQCVTIPVAITAPPSLPPGQAGCYALTVTQDGVPICDRIGRLWGAPSQLCWQRTSAAMDLALADTVHFTVSNPSATVDSASYEIAVLVPGTSVPDSVVALNGAAPGTLVLGSVMVQGASEVGVSVPFAFTHHLPLESREVVLSQRDPSTGTPIPVASAIIQSVAAIIPLVHDCNGNGIPDSVDIANGISHDLNGNGVPDECEAAVCSVTSVSPGAVGLTQLRYLGGAPNPSHGVVRLSLASGRCESVDLLISDVAGRIVRRWSLQTAGARLLSVDWDGRDESGRHTSSGVYFVTLRGRCGVAYGTLVLAR